MIFFELSSSHRHAHSTGLFWTREARIVSKIHQTERQLLKYLNEFLILLKDDNLKNKDEGKKIKTTLRTPRARIPSGTVLYVNTQWVGLPSLQGWEILGTSASSNHYLQFHLEQDWTRSSWAAAASPTDMRRSAITTFNIKGPTWSGRWTNSYVQ